MAAVDCVLMNAQRVLFLKYINKGLIVLHALQEECSHPDNVFALIVQFLMMDIPVLVAHVTQHLLGL